MTALRGRRLRAPDDDQLLARISGGDAGAFSVLYDRYAVRALCVARAVCPDPGQAEEAVQEGFLSIWRSSDTYRPQRAGPAAWVLTVMRHRAIEVSRRTRRHASRRADAENLERRAAPGHLSDDGAAELDARRLRRLLLTLPEAQREVITLAYYGELSHSEIAAHLDLPQGTVKGRMRLGLEKLRRQLER